MKATLWIDGKTTKIIIKDKDRVIDLNEEWNNRASAEKWIETFYPMAHTSYIDDNKRIKNLNIEWISCKNGM